KAEDGIRDATGTGVQTCALPIYFLDQVVVATAPADRPQLFRPVEQLEDSARVVGEASDDREIDFDEFGQPHSSERRDHRDEALPCRRTVGTAPQLCQHGLDPLQRRDLEQPLDRRGVELGLAEASFGLIPVLSFYLVPDVT